MINLAFYNVAYSQDNVIKGYIDLSNKNLENELPVKLTGEWEFYYNQIITPKEFSEKNNIETTYTHVPKLWNKIIVDGKKLKSEAVATYRLKLRVNKNIKTLAIRTESFYSAFNIYINDSLIVEQGKIKTKTQAEKPAINTKYTIFIVPDTVFFITINMSNFHHKKGGIQDEIMLGTIHNTFKYSRQTKSYELFVIGIMLIMTFYTMGLYILWKKNVGSLFFSLLTFSILMQLLSNNELLFEYFLKISNYKIINKIDFISIYLAVMFLGLYFKRSRPNYYNNYIIGIVTGILSLFSLIIIFTDQKFYFHTLIFFEIIAILYIPYLIYRLTKATFKKEKNAAIELAGTVIMFAATVNDILYENSLIITGNFIWIGLFIFTIIQSYAIAKKYAELFKYADDMNSMMAEIDEIKSQIIITAGTSIEKPVEIISIGNNATRGLLICSKNNEKFITKSNYSKYIHPENKAFPEKIIRKTIEENKIITIKNAYENLLLFPEEYLNEFRPKSILCCPLKVSNDETTLLYLENSLQTDIFTERTENIVSLLSTQILNLIDNFEKYIELEALNSQLEEIVEIRTIEVMQQREELKTQKDEIERQNQYLKSIFDDISLRNKEITDSINYAKRIQEALLPSKNVLDKAFPNNFIYFNPKETLSGDFYWIYNDEKKKTNIFTVADCTGHGVPGALMSIIGNNLLYSQVTEKKVTNPAKILDNIQTEITKNLKQNILSESKDGMDLAIISYNENDDFIEFAGARNPIILIRDNQIIEYRGDKMSIGGAEHARISANSHFSNIKIDIQKDDIIYFFSDGYMDQIGGKAARKFLKNRFYETLSLIHKDELDIQKQKLEEIFNKWKGENLQVDDVLIAGIKF